MNEDALKRLRLVITENLRVQRGGAESVPYIDLGNVLADVGARQNHAVFARRGCGKTLLLHNSASAVGSETRCVYLNCEDFKKHSFPNVLIQILDAVFEELEVNLTGWFGRKKKSKAVIQDIRRQLAELQSKADKLDQDVREAESTAKETRDSLGVGIANDLAAVRGESKDATSHHTEVERSYKHHEDKIRELDMWLPKLKAHVREFFDLSSTVKSVYVQIDDFYHLSRGDQPFVMDYIHRLCKDVPLYFKVATLRHASVLYADKGGQPIGAQERHDYQPINIDFTLANLGKTVEQNWKILEEFGSLAGASEDELGGLFKGEGFERLVMAGGGVPRDCLSLFLEVLDSSRSGSGDGRIGKDDVRILSRSNFERRVEELKQDSDTQDQDALIRGIYVIRRFCIDRQINVFLVSEQMMQQEDRIRDLIYRLLDYRIIHNAGAALTHKSKDGTYQAFAIDIGCYAHMRKLHGRFTEIDLSRNDAKERMRSAPILDKESFGRLWSNAPEDPEAALREEDDAA